MASPNEMNVPEQDEQNGVETLLLDHGLLAAAIVVGVLATLAGTGCWQGHLRGIRRDLETGRGAM